MHSSPHIRDLFHSIRIISGGQTGADRAGLDTAIARGIPHGGWCPKGRLAEDGPLPARYRLRETPSGDYLERTRRNVELAEATLVFTLGPPTRGSKRTLDFAMAAGKPVLHVDLSAGDRFPLARTVADFIRRHGVSSVNVAGSRESKSPGVHAAVCRVLGRALDDLGYPDGG